MERYHEVVDNGLPNAFPHMREVGHQIDMILGKNIPNKADYKISPS